MCTADDHHYPLDFSLEHLEDLLDPGDFFRVNLQYLVRFSSIEHIHILSKSRNKLEMISPPEILRGQFIIPVRALKAS